MKNLQATWLWSPLDKCWYNLPLVLRCFRMQTHTFLLTFGNSPTSERLTILHNKNSNKPFNYRRKGRNAEKWMQEFERIKISSRDISVKFHTTRPPHATTCVKLGFKSKESYVLAVRHSDKKQMLWTKQSNSTNISNIRMLYFFRINHNKYVLRN